MELSNQIAPGQVTIQTTATLIAAENKNRTRLVIVQGGTTDVFVGGSAVTAATGMLLSGTKGNQVVLRTKAAVYGIVASGSQAISYTEETKV